MVFIFGVVGFILLLAFLGLVKKVASTLNISGVHVFVSIIIWIIGGVTYALTVGNMNQNQQWIFLGALIIAPFVIIFGVKLIVRIIRTAIGWLAE